MECRCVSRASTYYLTVPESQSNTQQPKRKPKRAKNFRAKLQERARNIHLCQTPPVVAEYLGVEPTKVLGWIRSGELRASNASVGCKRKRYVIEPDALREFLQRRQVVPTPKPTTLKPRKLGDVFGLCE